MKESTELELAQGILADAVERVLSRTNDETTQQLRMVELRSAFFAYESAKRLEELQHYRELAINNAKYASDEVRRRLGVERELKVMVNQLRSALEMIATADDTAFMEWYQQHARCPDKSDWFIHLAKSALNTLEPTQ